MTSDSTAVPDDLSGVGSSSLIRVVVISYGDGHQDPPEQDGVTINLVDALRDLPDDPAARSRMTQLTGLDKEVRQYVMATPGARKKAEEIYDQAVGLLLGYADIRNRVVFVLIKSWDGRHRSVAMAEEVAALLRADGIGVETVHRHINRPVLPSRPKKP